MRSRFPVFAATVLIVLAAASAAQAKTNPPYNVTTTADAQHHNSALGGVCDTPCSLREAVESAQAAPGDDTIVLPEGHFVLANISDTASSLNLAADEAGGGLTITGAGATQTVIDANASEAGAPNDDRAMTVQPGMDVSISRLEVTGGIADDTNNFYGGDIANFGTLALDHVWLTGGSGFSAGAITNRGGNLTISNSLISGNAAGDRGGGGDGGAIVNFGDSALARMEITNTTITANQARTAAIATYGDFGATTVLDHDTIAFNQAMPLDGNEGRGTGGLADGQDTTTTTLKGTIVYGNTATFLNPSTTAPQNCGTDAGGTIVSAGGNLGGSVAECALNQPSDRPDTNPLLLALANNGGQTQTLALGAGSPAIDLAGAPSCPATDQRDHARPQGLGCDAGAYELDVAAPPPTTTTTEPPPPTTTTTEPPPQPPPAAQPSAFITGSILYDPAFPPGPPPPPASPVTAPGRPASADVALLNADRHVVAQQHVSFAGGSGKLGVGAANPVAQLAGTSPSFELDRIPACERCQLELLTGRTVQDAAPLDVSADDAEVDQNLTFGQLPDGQFAEGSIVAPKGTSARNFVVQIFGANSKSPLATTEKLPGTCTAGASGKGCAGAPVSTNGSIRWRLGGLHGAGSITAKLLQRNSKGKLIEIDTVHAKLAPGDTEIPDLTTIDIDPSGPAGRVLDGVVDYHPAFAPGAPDTTGEDLRSVPRAPKVTVELDGADGRPIAKANAEATSTGGKSGSAKGSASGPTAYRFTHLKPCPECAVRLLAGSVVQDSVPVDVTGDDPSIQRQDLEFDRLPGGTWVDGAVNVPAGVARSSVSVQVLQGATVVADSAKLANPCSAGKGAGAGATTHCASATTGGTLPFRLGKISPSLKDLTLALLWHPKGGPGFAIDSQPLHSGGPGSAVETSSMTIPDPQPTGPVGRMLTGAVTIDAPVAPGAPPDTAGIDTRGLTVELHGPGDVRLASVAVTSHAGAKSAGGAKGGGATPVQSYALPHLDACREDCTVVLTRGRTIEDSAPVIVPVATPSVTVAPLANNRTPSGPHLTGTLSFASSHSPQGLSVRVTVGSTVIADSSKLHDCSHPSAQCARATRFAFRLAKMPPAGGRATLEVRGLSIGPKAGSAKSLLSKSITLVSGADTDVGTIKVP